MDDDYDEDDYTMFTMGPPRGRRAGWFDFVVLSMHFVSELTSAVHSTAVAAYNLAAQHANFKIDQRDFHEAAAREIETMTTGDSDDG